MGTVRVIVKGTLGNAVETRNIFTYNEPNHTLNYYVANALATRMADMFAPLLPFISEVWEFYEVGFEQLVEGVWQPYPSIQTSHVGTAQDEILPFQNAALVSAYTLVKKTIGKKFIPGLTEAANIDGHLIPTLITALTSFLGFYISGVDVPGYGTWLAGTVKKDGTFHQFLMGAVRDLFATQRRRHPEVGI